MTERAESLSIKHVRAYKLFLMGILTVFVIAYSVLELASGNWVSALIGLAYPLLLILYWFPQMKKSMARMKELSYDSENLYVMENGYEISDSISSSQGY